MKIVAVIRTDNVVLGPFDTKAEAMADVKKYYYSDGDYEHADENGDFYFACLFPSAEEADDREGTVLTIDNDELDEEVEG